MLTELERMHNTKYCLPSTPGVAGRIQGNVKQLALLEWWETSPLYLYMLDPTTVIHCLPQPLFTANRAQHVTLVKTGLTVLLHLHMRRGHWV